MENTTTKTKYFMKLALSEAEKAKERDGSTVMGASKEELRNITKGENAIDLLKEAEKKGGNLDLEDFIRIHSGD